MVSNLDIKRLGLSLNVLLSCTVFFTENLEKATKQTSFEKIEYTNINQRLNLEYEDQVWRY